MLRECPGMQGKDQDAAGAPKQAAFIRMSRPPGEEGEKQRLRELLQVTGAPRHPELSKGVSWTLSQSARTPELCVSSKGRSRFLQGAGAPGALRAAPGHEKGALVYRQLDGPVCGPGELPTPSPCPRTEGAERDWPGAGQVQGPRDRDRSVPVRK